MSFNSTCAGAVQDLCFSVSSNPEISGIGVRTALYAQTILNMVVASWLSANVQLMRDTIRTSYILSFGLITSCIIQWCLQGLSLFDALISTMLVTLMTAFAGANYIYITTLGLSVNICSFLFFIIWTYWGLQIWVDPSTFGLRLPEDLPNAALSNCTANLDTIFVVFGKSVQATNPGLRIFALFTLSLGPIIVLHSCWTVFKWLVKAWLEGELEARINEQWRNIKRDKYNIGAGPGKTSVKSMGGLVVLIYTIVTTEQMISRNAPDGLSRWTFGQTLAVIMLLQQLIDIVLAFKEESEVQETMPQMTAW